jgi:hypothetical protein
VGQTPDSDAGSSGDTASGSGDSASGAGDGGNPGTTGTGSTTGTTTVGSTVTGGDVTTAGSSEGSTSDGSTTGGVSICDGRNPLYTCDEPNDCGDLDCGGYLSPWDADGCLRPACESDDDCADGMGCLDAVDWGGCFSSDPIACSDADGTCTCSGANLPDCGGRICIPEDALPPAVCGDFDQQGDCETAGCAWFFVPPVVDDAESYGCGTVVGTCLWFPEGQGGDDALTPYMRQQGATTDFPTGWAVFPAGYDAPPLGWTACGGPGPMSDVCTWWNDTGSC